MRTIGIVETPLELAEMVPETAGVSAVLCLILLAALTTSIFASRMSLQAFFYFFINILVCYFIIDMTSILPFTLTDCVHERLIKMIWRFDKLFADLTGVIDGRC